MAARTFRIAELSYGQYREARSDGPLSAFERTPAIGLFRFSYEERSIYTKVCPLQSRSAFKLGDLDDDTRAGERRRCLGHIACELGRSASCSGTPSVTARR